MNFGLLPVLRLTFQPLVKYVFGNNLLYVVMLGDVCKIRVKSPSPSNLYGWSRRRIKVLAFKRQKR